MEYWKEKHNNCNAGVWIGKNLYIFLFNVSLFDFDLKCIVIMDNFKIRYFLFSRI